MNMLMFLLYYMCQLDTALPLDVFSHTSIQYMDPYNLYGSPLSCTVHSIVVPVGTVQWNRLCGVMCTSGQSKPCNAFLLNNTDGTTECYICHYDIYGDYLLSQLDRDKTFVTLELIKNCKY